MPKYQPSGLLAVEPRAIGQDFDLPPAEPSKLVDGVALEVLRGPLYQHCSDTAESYDVITWRVANALNGPAKAVLLVIDSPGGLVSGLFDCARALRAVADATGKPLIAYVDGQACSAAYALASVCDRIYVSETGVVGSIGVVDCLVDQTANDAQQGFRFELITSGARKADGNPHTQISPAAIAASRKIVDYCASKFFALVASRRPLSVQSVKALEAASLMGELAVSARLADRVATFDDVLVATIAGRELDGMLTPEGAAALRAADAQPKPKALGRAEREALARQAQEAQWAANAAAHRARAEADPRGTAIRACKALGVELTEDNIERHMPFGFRKIDGYRSPKPALRRVSPLERPIDFSAIGAPIARRY